jgi:hypothetical protein
MTAMLATTMATSVDIIIAGAADKPRTDVPDLAYNFEAKLSP